MGVYEAAQMSNSTNWSYSISCLSLGLRSHLDLIVRAFFHFFSLGRQLFGENEDGAGCVDR